MTARTVTSLLAFATVAIAAGAHASTGDAVQGEHVFRKCKSCHMVGPDAKRRTGPELNGIVGAPAAAVEGYPYSEAIRAAAKAGLSWSAEALDAYLADPRAYMPGTRMTFHGLAEPQERLDVIAYLATFAPQAAPDEGAQVTFIVPAPVLAIEGDAEYGEYLSSECTTCHQASGSDKGIPSIIGWDIELFVTAMHAYRAKHRRHPVMEMVTARLGDEEIAALAAYFKGLGP